MTTIHARQTQLTKMHVKIVSSIRKSVLGAEISYYPNGQFQGKGNTCVSDKVFLTSTSKHMLQILYMFSHI